MWHLILVLALVRFAASTYDPELNEKFNSMPYADFVEYFNNQNYSWSMVSYPENEGKTLYYGAFINRRVETGMETISHDPELFKTLPENFDARVHWDHCDTIKEIYDQGSCGSCWTFGVANVVSDRICIHKGLITRLSEQDFECLHSVCNGGVSSRAFEHWRDKGLVTKECKPYNVTALKEATCVEECKDNSKNYKEDKHFGERVYRISSDDDDVRTELYTNGPIQASFQAYADFEFYKTGIYEHKFGKLLSGHSVRVIGYGVENDISYWLVANSWDTTWGENGYVKIKRYQEKLGFESRLLAGIPKN